jgi:hypothetical protein
MTRRLSRWIDKARTLESTIAARVEGRARDLTKPSARQPLEIVHAILDAVAGEVQPAGRGRHVFPFHRVDLRLRAASPKERAYLEVVCEGPPSLADRIAERLTASGCGASLVDVHVDFVAGAQPDWTQPEFHVEFTRRAGPPAVAPGARLELAVVRGTAARPTYAFSDVPIALGRGDDVRDTRDRLVRTNHVAFLEIDDDVNGSVSRRHARIDRDARSGGFRLFDDGSTQGTSVIRGGRGLPVPRGARGLLLQSGDEIVLGRARLGVTLVTGA